MNKYISIFFLSFVVSFSYAQSVEELFDTARINFVVDSIENELNYQTGRVPIVNGDAYIDVPKNFKFLDGEQAEYVLSDLWGNPPSGQLPEGLLVPKDHGVLNNVTYAIEITYEDIGFINDEDAKEIDYEELLESIKEDSELRNEYLRKEGYSTVEIIGWAAPPRYDEVSKKLYWAQEAKFGNSVENTLNYNIRILGRKGLVNLNAIGSMEILDLVEKEIPDVLASVHYNEGSRYSDFDSSYDKVAAVGIGGLIAGKVLAKAGILAKLGILLAKFWKIIALAIFGLFAGVRKFFGGDRSSGKSVVAEQPQTRSNRDEEQQSSEEE